MWFYPARHCGLVDRNVYEMKCDTGMKDRLYKIIVVSILLITCVTRFLFLGDVPGDGALHSDEAFAGYNAWSIINYGMDSEGYHNPVYFVVWGSGQSALMTYCMIPFVALFGLNALGIRACSAILGVISVYFFYRLLRDYAGRMQALVGAGIIAIIPWHIMISRWSLDCNFFPGFLLISIYFFIKAVDNSKMSILAMLFYGISLYAYAADWVVMPFLLIGIWAFFWRSGKVRIDRYWLLSFAVLGTVAAPLLLLVLVNTGHLNPIMSSVFSIPKLSYFRNSEVALSRTQLFHNIRMMMRMLIKQDDALLWNSMPKTGIYYYISAPFMIIGMISTVVSSISKNLLSQVMLLWFLCSVILGCLIDGNINRLNIIHIPIIYFITIGICHVIRLFVSKARFVVAGVVVFAYLFSFVIFAKYYNSEYSRAFSIRFSSGMKDALKYINQQRADKLFIQGISYPEVLVNLEYPTDEFVNTVKWNNAEASFRPIDSFGDKYFFRDFNFSSPQVGVYYLVNANNDEGKHAFDWMNSNDMDILQFDNVYVGTISNQ